MRLTCEYLDIAVVMFNPLSEEQKNWNIFVLYAVSLEEERSKSQ